MQTSTIAPPLLLRNSDFWVRAAGVARTKPCGSSEAGPVSDGGRLPSGGGLTRPGPASQITQPEPSYG